MLKRLLIPEKSFYKTLLLLALPIVLQNMISTGLSMMDNVMVGSLGEISISGVTQANQIFFVFSLFIAGLSGGSGVMVSQYWGKKDTKGIGHIFALSMLVSAVIGTIFMLGALLIPEQLMSIYTNEPALIAVGARYLKIIAFTFVPYSLSFTLLINLRSVEKPMVALAVNVISFTINTFLNWCLIFGKLGFPALGVEGAAIATVVARLVEMGAILYYVFLADETLNLRLREIFKIPGQMTRDFCRYCMPVLINEAIWGFGYSSFAMILGRTGISNVTAFSAARTLEMFVMVVGNGIGSACAVMVGTALGRSEMKEAKSTARTLLTLAAGAGVLCGGLMVLVRPLFLSFYTMSAETHRAANWLILAMAIYIVIKNFNFTMIIGVLRAGGDTRYAAVVDVLFLWTLSIPLAALAGLWLKLPIFVIYCALMVDELIKMCICIRRFRSDQWMKNITRAESDDGILEK